MAFQLNIFGQCYDDETPAFLLTTNAGFVWDRIGKRLFSIEQLKAEAEKRGYTFGEKEIGGASKDYLKSAAVDFVLADSPPPIMADGYSTSEPEPEPEPEPVEDIVEPDIEPEPEDAAT